MAVILIAENQYSKLPKAFTLVALISTRAAENERIQIHSATCGNQNFMYLAIAVTSVPTARTMQAQ
ncbi:hypothetical protein D9M71_555860 [compost metagenome]